jgi:adenosine 3'-phospho 5'-phosphosulfate transporter B3
MVFRMLKEFPQKLEALSPTSHFLVLALGVFFFFGLHNLLQEAIMAVPDFKHGVMLGYMEVLGVAVCSFMERQQQRQHERVRVAPMSAYPLLTLCLLTSSALSNMSLNYINFPTKVVFRSCKLIPTMVVATVLHNKIFTTIEYACALAVCCGLVMFAAADWTISPSFNPIGLAMVCMSVVADAVLPNAQERLFKMGSSRLEVTLYTNMFTLLALSVTTLLSGDLIEAVQLIVTSQRLIVYFTIYTFVAYLAISMHMSVVKRFGGVAAVLLATGRKGMTLVLSFLLFPKTFSWYYPIGAALVLGGLTASSLLKEKSKNVTVVDTRISPRNGRLLSPTLKAHASDAHLEAFDLDMEAASLLKHDRPN